MTGEKIRKYKVKIILKSNIDDNEICTEDYNYLSAYQKLRDKLLDMNYGIKCKGSQLNAVPPEMLGACDKIYLVHMGHQKILSVSLNIPI
ncbi:MAG: hypothetical protein NC177_11005 [Ruminococcus flavefaciens]|nr:hypothetical protein [Ruminococcus flavefaciens]